MRSFFLTLLAPALLGLVLWTGCSSSSASQEGPFTFGEPITDSTIAMIVTSDDLGTQDTLFTAPYLQQVQMILMQSGGSLDSLATREVFRRVAEGFVFDVLLRDLAKRDTTIPLDYDRARTEFANVKAQLGEEAVAEELTRSGMTEDSVLTMLALQFRIEAMMQQVADQVAAPTPQEIEAWRAEQSQEVKVRHILLPFQVGGPEEEASLRTLATSLLDSARQGTDFSDLARRHSQDASAALGGVLDYFSRGTGFPKPFTDAAFALQNPGDLSDVVEAPYGFHLIRLDSTRIGTPPDTTLAVRVLQGEKQNDAFIAYLDEAMRRHNIRVRINPEVIEVDLNNRYKED